MTSGSDWMGVEWSRERLRIWVFGADGALREEITSGDGTDFLSAEAFEPTLASVIAGHLQDDAATDILVAGPVAMPGLWGGGALRSVPCAAPGPGDLSQGEVTDDRLKLHLVNGIAQDRPDAVMFADGVRIAGFLATYPEFDGVICLPGLVSRWVHVSAGEIVSFQHLMTGRLIAATSRTMGIAPDGDTPEAVFLEAVEDAMARPQAMAGRIGAVEAALTLGRMAAAEARGRIAGGFVGLELAATRPYWLGQRVALVGGDRSYRAALAQVGVTPEVADEAQMLRAGFCRIKGIETG